MLLWVLRLILRAFDVYEEINALSDVIMPETSRRDRPPCLNHAKKPNTTRHMTKEKFLRETNHKSKIMQHAAHDIRFFNSSPIKNVESFPCTSVLLFN